MYPLQSGMGNEPLLCFPARRLTFASRNAVWGAQSELCREPEGTDEESAHPASPFPTRICTTPQNFRAQNPRKSKHMLRVCDQRHRQVYTCRAICTCESGIAVKAHPCAGRPLALGPKSFLKHSVQARVLPSSIGVSFRYSRTKFLYRRLYSMTQGVVDQQLAGPAGPTSTTTQ